MNNKKQLSLYVKAFFLNLILAAAAFAGFIIVQGGLFSLAGDFDVQQIPFAMYANDAIRSGNVVWDWSLDLGSNFIGGMSFYVLGNPSFWISMLFPSRYFMYAVGWIYVLKYGVAGLTSFAYMKRYVKEPRAALIGSMLYAFSGFMNVNLLFYHFHDVVALFPLMLLTLDGFVLDNKKGPFIFAVFINAVTNYYFLIGEVIFLVAYYFLRYPGEMKKRLILFVQALREAVLGCMIGAVLLLPSFFFVIQNPRVTNDYKGSNSLVFSAERYLFILKGLLFPAEIQSDQSAVISSNFSSCSAYLPLIGLTLVIAFFYYHEKHWLKNILKFSLVMTSVPVLNASFSLFAGLYHRWYYMPVLMMTLASAMMLDAWESEDRVRDERSRKLKERFIASEYEENDVTEIGEADIGKTEIGDVRRSATRSERAIKKGAFLWGLTAILFIAFLSFVKWSDSEPSKIYRPVLFASSALISFGGIWLTWLIFSQFPKQARRLF
ncbi:MAG: YfhO family protein, partial [Lachnospiraceae bacterium]|nr:YfhO family protein [Lachnospiraceae bacterium]